MSCRCHRPLALESAAAHCSCPCPCRLILALIDARDAGRLDLEIVHVISNVHDAPGLARAARADIRSSVLDHRSFGQRDDFDRALAVLMAAHDPEIIILAGFMRIIGPRVLEPYAGRMINLHPSLLPLYRGTGTYQRAIDAGAAPQDLATKIMTTADPETGQGFDVAEMVDQVAIFFLAGHETSASALAWALYLLARYPQWQEQVATEAAAFTGEFADLSRLTPAQD